MDGDVQTHGSFHSEGEGYGDRGCRDPRKRASAACLNDGIFDILADARRKLAIWLYDCNNVRLHSSLGNKAPAEARRALEQSEGSAPGALAQPETDQHYPQEFS